MKRHYSQRLAIFCLIFFAIIFCSGSVANAQSSSVIPQLTRDTLVRMLGEAIRNVQIFLNNNGFPVALFGPGSKGHETTTFGFLTKAALEKYRQANSGSNFNSTSYYTLNYSAGLGGTVTGNTSQKIKAGENGNAVTAVPDNDYLFSRWSDGSTVNPRTDVNVVADKSVLAIFSYKWFMGGNPSGVTYTLTYTAGPGGTITGTTPQTVSGNQDGTTVTAVPDTNYHFLSWSDGVLTTSRTDTTINASKSVIAQFAIDTFTVTFDGNTNTGGATAAQTINGNSSASLTANGFTKTSYTFAGWATTSGGSVAYADTASYTMGTANVTLYAKWTADNHTVTFDTNGGTGGATAAQTIATDATAALTANGFTKTGYSFAGWATTAGGTVAYANEASYTMGTASVTLYAKWTANNNTVTFDGNTNTGGSTATQTIATDATAALTANGFTKTGYNFSGWATTSGGSVAYADGASYTMGTSNVTLYAVWVSACGPTFTDSRDSQVYNANQIGSACWMSQNLNIGTRVHSNSGLGTSCSSINKYCPANSDANCITYGGLYIWTQAMCGGTTTPGAQGICPTGWHIPTHDEYTAMERAVCTSGSCLTDFPLDTTTIGWTGTNEGGLLKSGAGLFKALMAGTRDADGNLSGLGVTSYFWNSSSVGSDAWYRRMDADAGNTRIYRGKYYNGMSFSLRCVKD